MKEVRGNEGEWGEVDVKEVCGNEGDSGILVNVWVQFPE